MIHSVVVIDVLLVPTLALLRNAFVIEACVLKGLHWCSILIIISSYRGFPVVKYSNRVYRK